MDTNKKEKRQFRITMRLTGTELNNYKFLLEKLGKQNKVHHFLLGDPCWFKNDIEFKKREKKQQTYKNPSGN